MIAERHRLGLDRHDELWEGVLHMVPPATHRHQSLEFELAKALEPTARDLGGLRDPSCQTLRRLVEAGGERLRLVAEPVGSGVMFAADDEERARRLMDVLSLADAVPVVRRPAVLRAPPMMSRRAC